MGYGDLALWSDGASDGFPRVVFSKIRNHKWFPTNKATVVRPTPANPKVDNKADSEPASERDETGCMAHIIYVNFERKKISLVQLPCGGSGSADVVLLNEDWISSLAPAYYITGVTLSSVHIKMYGPLMGSIMCFEKECVSSGTHGPNGRPYCPEHMSAAVTPHPRCRRLIFVATLVRGRI